MSSIEFITLTGTVIFGISGALAGAKRGLDIFGSSCIACISALGGSTIRDILIGHYPMSWVSDSRYVIAVLLGVVIAWFVGKHINKMSRFMFLLDTIGIGIFTIISVQNCLVWGVTPGLSIMFGVLSTIAGGVLRDVICNDVPLIFKKELSAVAALVGAGLFVLLSLTPLPKAINAYIAIVVIISIRFLSRRYQISLPSLQHE